MMTVGGKPQKWPTSSPPCTYVAIHDGMTIEFTSRERLPLNCAGPWITRKCLLRWKEQDLALIRFPTG